jgi:branched-chain amino acid transport system ATP-binding protein
VVILGTNGAGKTTTLRAISGFIGLDDAEVSDGSIQYKDLHIEDEPPHRITARGIVLVPERSKVFEGLSVADNLEAAHRPGADRRRLAHRVYEIFPRLAELRRRQAGLLSGGERQMLAIGTALMCAPELLLVDELSQGLAPLLVEQLLERLQTIRRELGMTILLVEQNAKMSLDVADHGYIMENGRVVFEGSADRLRSHADVAEFYLGGLGSRRSYRDVKQYRRSRRWYG